ncbi:branched-chain amino acid ABC transporter permease (plasmid) [Haloferax sp. S1W]|uniref:branched-chain amino acid ABC transporter permease n=1 Tax=Haloferax sp. S1W TaxID=3377110 RepID=UPI0037C772DC
MSTGDGGSSSADRLLAVQSSRHAPLLKGALGFGLMAILPYVVTVSLFGITLNRWISVHILIVTLVWAFTAQSWNIMSGYAGQFSFGHVAFFGIGAYATQVLLVDFSINPWFGLLVGSVIAACYGLFAGFLTFRYKLRGHFFALATLAFGELARLFVTNIRELNGASGYFRPSPGEYGLEFGLFAFQFNSDLPYYYLILVFLLVVTVVSWLIRRSSVGLYLLAIRENETAASSLGISPYRYKMLAVAVSAFFTAWAGSFWSMYFNTISPSTVFDIFRNVEILLPALLGGIGTVAGPILGSFIVTPLSNIARQTFGDVASLDRAIYGALLLLVILFSPRGVLGWSEQFRGFFGNRTSAPVSEAPDTDESDAD